jgi:hypothetical protein
MGELKILIPYNFTTHEFKTLDFVVDAFGHRKGTRVTFFHCYTPLPDLDVTADPLLSKVRNGMHFLREELRKKEAGLVSAKNYLLENDFSDDQVNFIFKKREGSIAGEIAAAVQEGDFSVLILTPTPGKVKRFFAQSVHDRALKALNGITVCVVL